MSKIVILKWFSVIFLIFQQQCLYVVYDYIINYTLLNYMQFNINR